MSKTCCVTKSNTIPWILFCGDNQRSQNWIKSGPLNRRVLVFANSHILSFFWTYALLFVATPAYLRGFIFIFFNRAHAYLCCPLTPSHANSRFLFQGNYNGRLNHMCISIVDPCEWYSVTLQWRIRQCAMQFSPGFKPCSWNRDMAYFLNVLISLTPNTLLRNISLNKFQIKSAHVKQKTWTNYIALQLEFPI